MRRSRTSIAVCLAFAPPALLLAFAVCFGGCGSKDSSGGDDAFDASAHHDGATAGDDASTAGGDGAPNCSGSTVKASDDPQCDQCAKANCCAEVQACEKSADCKALGDCLDKCSNDDQQCILTCQVVHQKGADVAQDLGACATDKCSDVCKAPDAGGFDFDF